VLLGLQIGLEDGLQEALLRAAWPSDASAPSDEERVSVRLPCSPEVSTKWVAALELARRVAGENLPTWECAEAIAAECASGAAPVKTGRPATRERREMRCAPEAGNEPGLRAVVWPHLR
jgi:hypothetical protein